MNILKKKKIIDVEIVKKKIFERQSSKNFCLFILGLLISALAFNLFYNPNSIIPTGTTGLSLIINSFTEYDIDISLLVFVFSSLILCFGFALMGIEYGAKAILGTILYPVFLKFTSLFVSLFDFNGTSLFLLVVIGSLLNGFGFGLIKKSNYNMGGFSTIYDILNKYLHISIGKASVVCNTMIIVLGAFSFGVDKFIYSFIALYIYSYISDHIMLGVSNNKAFYIVTSKPLEVRNYIVNNLSHTVTIVNARGGYTNKRKKMLMCVIPTIYYAMMKEVIKEIDNKAFILIADTYSISR